MDKNDATLCAIQSRKMFHSFSSCYSGLTVIESAGPGKMLKPSSTPQSGNDRPRNKQMISISSNVTEIQINLINLATEGTQKIFKMVCMRELSSNIESSQSPKETTRKDKSHI